MNENAKNIMTEIEQDTKEFAMGDTSFSMEHVPTLIWNMFVSKKYLTRLSGQDVKDIILEWINRAREVDVISNTRPHICWDNADINGKCVVCGKENVRNVWVGK